MIFVLSKHGTGYWYARHHSREAKSVISRLFGLLCRSFVPSKFEGNVVHEEPFLCKKAGRRDSVTFRDLPRGGDRRLHFAQRRLVRSEFAMRDVN